MTNIWPPFTQTKIADCPIHIKKAKGAYLYTKDNKKLFDGISSWWVNAHGHAHKEIAEAISEQAKNLDQIIFANFTHDPAITLAKKVLEIAPKNLAKVFFSDDGSTAVEVALKMAYQYWANQNKTKPYFIALEHGYHGDTFGAMSLSARGVFNKVFWPLLFDVIHVPAPCVSEIRDDLSEDALTKNALTKLKEVFHTHKNKIAGIILEPMLQGAGGMRMFSKGFLSGVETLIKENNSLLIADEILTGFYRTGTPFGVNHEAVMPDIMCLSKGLTSGSLPLSLTLATHEIYNAFYSDDKAKALLHGHSFTANPLGCAAAIKSIELFNNERIANIKVIKETLKKSLSPFKNLEAVLNARSIGPIAAIELKTKDSGYMSSSAQDIRKHCLNNGLFIRPLGNVIYLMPPFCATKQEIEWAMGLIYNGIKR